MPPQKDISDYEEMDNSIQFGKILANPPPGEEIVISGVSGHYPESENVHQFRDNLFNKVDMVTGDNRRWKPGHPEIPQRTGKIPDIKKFDAGYFDMHHLQTTQTDPMCRIFLEVVIEAIFDAGLHPSDLEGSNTGVFVGTCFSETELTWFTHNFTPQGFAIKGNLRSMIANTASNFLKLKGPSFVCDTACSSSLYALENAYRAIRMGICERAIVGGSNLCLHPCISLQFARLGVLSHDGSCKAFDKAGNGYARSETISAIILQRSKEAKRIYATILHAKTNCDGYKNSGITYPSGEMQTRLLKEFYQECDFVKSTDLSFLEAHGTGTKVGDPEELQAIDEVFTEGRTTPLLIGSVKSNIGHTEPSSGLCSITKAVIAFETNYIPPNIHYTTCRPGVKGLEEGRLQVVTDKMQFKDNRGLIGINSFGFGGGNCHILLKRNQKEKRDQRKAEDNIPRLVCVSGRTREAIETLLDDVVGNNADVEHIGLLHEIFSKNIDGHLYRGFSLVSKTGEIVRSHRIFGSKYEKLKLALCFGNIDKGINKSAKDFLEVPITATTMARIHEILLQKGINLHSIISKSQNKTVLEEVLVNFALQILIADLIKACDIVPQKIFGITKGFSLGTLICAYFDNALTLQEATECAYAIAFAAYSISCNDCVATTDISGLLKQNGPITTRLQQTLTMILKKPRQLSNKVIFESTSPEISAEYLTNCFGGNAVLGALKGVLKKSWSLFEIGNGELVQTLTKELGYNEQKLFSNADGEINSVLCSLGRLYEIGFNPQVQNIYPKIEFPVSRGTPMISPKIKWNHKRDWFVTTYEHDMGGIEEKDFSVTPRDQGCHYLRGHVVDGRNLIPAAYYLQIVWETLAYFHGTFHQDMSVVFENCKFKRATTFPKDQDGMTLTVLMQIVSGNFEVVEGNSPVVTGRIYQVPDNEMLLADLPMPAGVDEDTAPYLNKKDVYKELRLRGYNYSGQFKAIQSCDSSAQVAHIAWENDNSWVTFMDNMLQMKILQEDTRLLYVPTSIRRLAIDARRHRRFIKKFGEKNVILPAYAFKDIELIRSGGIEIKGLIASSIARKKYLGQPVIEKYVFVGNEIALKTEQAIRADMQILLENIPSIKVKVVELIDEATNIELPCLGEIIFDVLGDQPLIQPDITILSKTKIEEKNVKVEDRKLLTEVDCSLVVGSKILQRSNVLQVAFSSIKENGFILSREPLEFEVGDNKDIRIVTVFTNGDEKLVLFRKSCDVTISSVIKVSSDDEEFTWLPKLQKAIAKNPNVLVYSQGDELNGALGLVSCIRREPGAQNVRLVFISDSAPEFDLNLPFYSDQLNKNLAINVYKDHQWGTYRHLLMNKIDEVESEHCYLNSLRRGDLSSLSWFQGPLKIKNKLDSDRTLVHVHYAAINFRDVMTATGKINADSITRDRREQECVQGFEFSGVTDSGEKVMGMVTNGACASLVAADRILLWKVPDNCTLEEAVTIPVAYATCFVGFVKRAKMKRGDTVLIHSGTGGVGLSAIELALLYGCTVYTTVGTPEKRTFLKERFPQLKDHHISNSRTTEFEQHIMTQTNGKGVDIVLNSLAEEKLLASVRCLAKDGRFIEIGKFDLANNNEVNLLLLNKGASFHGLMVDALMSESSQTKMQIYESIHEILNNKNVRALPRTIFKMKDAEAAFRYMTTGKHMGKVVIKIKDDENDTGVPQAKFACLPRYLCDENKTYIICGGLGGFGLELADWLVLRNCRNLVLTSRHGIKTGYQAYRISTWRSYGCTVQVATDDITTYEGCQNLIEAANELGPVHAIFNLAVILRDSLFENQSEEAFKTSFGPKAVATKHLDAVTRKLCPELRDFVVFSSVSCGRGNAGQTNYGMSNSVMERICEKRRREGLPALAVQWGAIGDVGLVADLQDEAIEIEIGGTLQQRISNCLELMDNLLKQNEAAIVSSIVVAEKKTRIGGADNIVDAVAAILGIKDLKSISLNATLAEVGMDSMTAVEIKQTAEREYEVFLTPQDIKTMTFAKLLEIQTERDAEKQAGVKKERPLIGMDMILRLVPDEVTVNTIVMPIQGKSDPAGTNSTVVIFPGIEGVISVLEPLYKYLRADLVGLQFPNNMQKDTIVEMAKLYVPIIEEKISKEVPFKIICYSFGGPVALQTIHFLEEKGYCGTVVVIDGAPSYLRSLMNILEVESDEKLQVSLLVHLITLQHPYEIIAKHMEALFKCDTFEDKINFAQSVLPINPTHSLAHQKECVINIYKRLKALTKWTPDFKLKSKIVLFKPNLVSISGPAEEISDLSALTEVPLEVKYFDGNHATILEHPEVGKAASEVLGLPVPSS